MISALQDYTVSWNLVHLPGYGTVDVNTIIVYISRMPQRRIYLLSPKKHSPETIAVAFAKTSRSPESFDEIAEGLTDEASAKFHERWVVGYGHASVAEHAVLHIAIENVSRLAVECIESNRLASYTEKSTRYQKWESDDFIVPPELENHPLRDLYVNTCRNLFDTYQRSLGPLRSIVENQNPRRDNESEESYDRRIRSQYVDSCRFLLPAASFANLGMTANARVLEHGISKMLSHPLIEVQMIGEELKNVVLAEVPTLCKYASPHPSLSTTTSSLNNLNGSGPSAAGDDWCRLIEFDPDGENKILAATLYRSGELTFKDAQAVLRAANSNQREKFTEDLLGQLAPHDAPAWELEHTSYTFDIILDQGGYAEFKRHRMMTQTAQALTTRLGYALPRQMATAGFERQYRSAMEKAGEAFETLYQWNPQVASYVVPNGFNRRILFTLNLREAFTFCRLRSAATAHFSMRRVAQRVAEEIRKVHPLIGRYLSMPDETWQGIEKEYFSPMD